MLSRLADRLENEETAYYMLTGSTGKEKRAKLVEEFNKEDNPTAVFLISLKAGGTGLNLTGADVVIHYDPWWNLAVQNQATDRAHRLGQTKTVTVYKTDHEELHRGEIMKLQEAKKIWLTRSSQASLVILPVSAGKSCWKSSGRERHREGSPSQRHILPAVPLNGLFHMRSLKSGQ